MLVVGDSHTLKVHLHTDEPGRATALFEEIGEVSRLDVADMTEQVQERSERLAEAVQTCGVLAVVAGSGMRELFEGLGAVALDGGDTLNPSTYELLAGIHDVPAEEVVVLPNSPNVMMAAERAAELAEKTVHVVPTRSMQAGLAAAVALDPTRSAPQNAAAMDEALDHVRTGAVTEAARDDAEGRFRRGDAVGFIDEELVAWGEPEETLEAVLGELGREAELLTLIEGDGAPLDCDAVAALVPGGVDVESRAATSPPTGGSSPPSSGGTNVNCGWVGRRGIRPHGLPIDGFVDLRRTNPSRAVARSAASMPKFVPAHRNNARVPHGVRHATRCRRRAAAPSARRATRGPRGSPRRSKPPKAAAAAERLGLNTVGDLLEHLPRDRQDARTIVELGRGRRRPSWSRCARSRAARCAGAG